MFGFDEENEYFCLKLQFENNICDKQDENSL